MYISIITKLSVIHYIMMW